MYFELGEGWGATSAAQTCRGSGDICKANILRNFCLRLHGPGGGVKPPNKLLCLLKILPKALFITRVK